MSDKITVLCIKDTGHVLAALTRAADPEAEITAEALAGEDGLQVRGVGATPNSNALFPIPAGELKAVVVDSKPGVIENPRGFYLDENGEVQQFDAGRQISNFSLSGNPLQLSLTVNAAAQTDKAAVWVRIPEQDPNQSQTLTGEKAAGSATFSVGVSALGPGSPHYILVLVKGVPPYADEHP